MDTASATAWLHHETFWGMTGASLLIATAAALGTYLVLTVLLGWAMSRAKRNAESHQERGAAQVALQVLSGTSHLLILLADVGSGPARWLAERLPQVDIVLAARGQDLWPQAIEVAQVSGRKVPLLLAGSRACGAFQLHATMMSNAC